jgi:hypothetical protein
VARNSKKNTDIFVIFLPRHEVVFSKTIPEPLRAIERNSGVDQGLTVGP